MSSKQKPLNSPQTVHDVGDIGCNHDFIYYSTEKQKVDFSGDNDGNMFKLMH
jgi:hypothetical protein